MNYLKPLILFFTLTLLLVSCSDFLVEDISDDKVNLRAPFNGAVSEESLISFWWDTLEFVDGYRLEVISPSFDNPLYVAVLTEQADNIYDIELTEGSYQWTVTAYNSSYEAPSDTFDLVVDNSITDTTPPDAPNLSSPPDESTTDTGVISFEWDSDDESALNTLEIYSDSLLNNSVLDLDISSDNYSYEILFQSTYYWRVKSEDQSGNISDYSEIWKLTIE